MTVRIGENFCDKNICYFLTTKLHCDVVIHMARDEHWFSTG